MELSYMLLPNFLDLYTTQVNFTVNKISLSTCDSSEVSGSSQDMG